MSEHFLDSSITHNFWDRSYPPRQWIESGDVVTFQCGESSGGQVTPATVSADLPSVDRSRLHALVGPVFVNGAREGDVLEIDILDFQHHGWGFTYITPGSLLAGEFMDPFIHHWCLEGSSCYFKDDRRIVVPFEPFCGTMGVAPRDEGRFNTYPPRKNAGNIDIRSLGKGAKLWLPVLTSGALFSTGDCHAAQGDGEVCGTAIECPMTVRLRFILRKDISLEELQFETPSPITQKDTLGFHVTNGVGPDLYKDAQDAVRNMIDYLVSKQGLSREEAYILCSVVVDLKISNIVTPPNWIVSAYLPLSIFHN